MRVKINDDIVIENRYLKNRELQKIGTEKICLTCRKKYIIGENELRLNMLTEKGRNKEVYEVLVNNDILDIGIKNEKITSFGDSMRSGKHGLNPIKPVPLKNFTMAEQCIIIGVQFLHLHVCPDCKGINFNKFEATIY